MLIYLFWGEGGQRERERNNPKQAHAASAKPNVGLYVANHETMTWAKTKSRRFNQLSATQASHIIVVFNAKLSPKNFPPLILM